MPILTFFRQARDDGGIRTGIDVDGNTVDYFEDGTGDDPALSWFIDLRVVGDDVPADPQHARQWLLENKSLVNRGYQVLADKVRAGIDPDVIPVSCDVPDAPPGITTTTVCSTSANLNTREINVAVHDVSEHWAEYLERIPRVQSSSY